MANRHPAEVARFINAYEEERVIHRGRNGELHVKRDQSTVSVTLGKVVNEHVARRIREERRQRRLTMIGLAERAGIKGNKTRIAEIEKCQSGGIKLGTLYAIAAALGMSPLDLLPSADVVLAQSGVSMVGDMRLYTREEVERMVRAVSGPRSVKP